MRGRPGLWVRPGVCPELGAQTPPFRGEQPGKALAALVCAGGGMGGAGISRLLTPVSVALTIPAIFGCFWGRFGTHSLPPEMPGTGAKLLCCVLGGTARGGHRSPSESVLFFSRLMCPSFSGMARACGSSLSVLGVNPAARCCLQSAHTQSQRPGHAGYGAEMKAHCFPNSFLFSG